MKFSTQIPEKSGWYWIVDADYPVPIVAYIQNPKLWEWGRECDLRRWHNYRFGEQIIEPDCQTNEIEH